MGDIDMRTITIGLVVIMVVFWIASAILKRSTFNKMQRLLMEGNFDELYALLDSKLTVVLFPEYNRTYLKLNAKIMEGDDAGARAIFDDLLSRHLTKKLRRDIVLKAFSYYLDHKDGKRSRALLEEIEGWDSDQDAIKQHSRRTFDIVIKKSSAYIADMEAELEGATGVRRGQLLFFLALQYENAGDKKKADEYYDQASRIAEGALGIAPDDDGGDAVSK